MIKYSKCSEVEKKLIYEAFKIGFSDYIIAIDMEEKVFFERFFGPEGNTLENSFIAMDGEKAVGVILGGIKNYEGIKTIRCGTLAIHPEYRGCGVSQKLFELHRQDALNNNCKQMFLEVIVGNDRAISFYKKLGYEKIYDLSYFSLDSVSHLKERENHALQFRNIDMKELKELREDAKDAHINWQNDLEYIDKLEGQIHFGAYYNDELIGVISGSKNGKISIIYVKPGFRCIGIGGNLLIILAKSFELEKLNICFPNNASLEGFMRKVGFTRMQISQYEMYLTNI